MPELLPRVIPLHQLVKVDAFIAGCPPDAERIWAAVGPLLQGEMPVLEPEMRLFG
jgi:NAD-reducing hydrogenase small subunit